MLFQELGLFYWPKTNRFSEYIKVKNLFETSDPMFNKRGHMTYNRGQKSLGHCTFKQGNAITLERQTLRRRFYTQFPLPPPPSNVEIHREHFGFTDSTLFGWGEGRGGQLGVLLN